MAPRILPCLLSMAIVHLVSPELLATDPDYVSQVEMNMAAALRLYMHGESSNMASMDMYVKFLQERSTGNSKSSPRNPIDLFRTVKSVGEEWKGLRDVIEGNRAAQIALEVTDRNLDLPNSTDAEEVALAIFRLQDTYLLTPSEIIAENDRERKAKDKDRVSARDCFDIAMVAFNRLDDYHALMWLREAETRSTAEKEQTLTDLELWRPLAVSLHERGNYFHSHGVVTKLKSKLDRMSSAEKDEALKGFPDLVQLMEHHKTDEPPEETAEIRNERNPDQRQGVLEYESICRGGAKIPAASCHFKTDTPYLRLAPAKVEILNVDPLVLLFRGIISDNESATIRESSRENLHRAKIFHGARRVFSEERSSSHAWLHRNKHPFLESLHQRISDYTGLDIRKHGDPLQVARYGFGGHYSLHYDHMREQHRQKYGFHGSFNNITGDRMATLMFYLSEPDAGGLTVFPLLSISVPPTKNDALFWYNLRKDGSGIDRMLHGGCPVISGGKWVANQWIRERGQEFVRPCGLRQDDGDRL